MTAKNERKNVLMIVFGSGVIVLLFIGVFVLRSLTLTDVSTYPNALSLQGTSSFPPLHSQFSGRRLIVERNRFFTTTDSDQQVALWYQQAGWRDLTTVGQRWELVPGGTAVNIHHSAIIYSDFFQEVCKFEDTCIFVRTTISLEMPEFK